MSDRPKWMPSEQEVNDASMAFLLARGESDVFEKLYERLGLRAQVAVLEEIVHQPSYDRIAAKIALLRKELE